MTWWVEYCINGHRIRRSTETASRRDASRIAKQFQEDDREHARKTKVSQKSNNIMLDGACGSYWIEHARHLVSSVKGHEQTQLVQDAEWQIQCHFTGCGFNTCAHLACRVLGKDLSR